MKLLSLPPVDLDAYVQRMTTAEKQQAGRELDSIAATAAAIRGYLDMRSAVGCGDHGHAEALEDALEQIAQAGVGVENIDVASNELGMESVPDDADDMYYYVSPRYSVEGA